MWLSISFVVILLAYMERIFSSILLPFLIYLFRQNAKLFPIELIKSARIDGVSELGIFFKIFVPNIKATILTAGLILFINTWNGFLYPLIIIQSREKTTLALYINSIGSSYTTDYGIFMTALLLSTLPILIIFSIAQKQFEKGLRVSI